MSYLGNPLSTVDFPVDYFTGDGTSTTFQLSRIPASATSILVHIGGVKQVASTTDPAYYLDGSKLVFVSPPGAYSPIEVNYLGIAGQVNIPGTQSVTQDMLSLQLANTFVYQTTANGATASFTLNAPPVSANSLVVSANGVVQYDYSVNGTNLTFGFTPPVGTFIRVTSLALAQAGVPADGSVTSVKLGANLTITGNTTFDGFAGNPARIRGDFTNATIANRAAIQTNTTNGNTVLGIIPNGTATQTQLQLFSSPDFTNYSRLAIQNTGSEMRLYGDSAGSGTALPLTMYTAATERMRIDTSGNVGIGTTTALSILTALGTSSTVTNPASTRSPIASIRGGNNNNRFEFYVDNSGATAIMGLGAYNTAGGATDMTFYTGASVTERMRIDSSGNVGIGTSSPTLTSANRTVVSINGTSTSLLSFNTANATKSYLYNDGTNLTVSSYGGIFFNSGVSDTERMRIDSSGNVGIGTTSIESFGGGHKTLELSGSTNTEGGVFKTATSSSAGSGSTGTEMLMFTDSIGGKINVVSTHPAVFYTANAERMRITAGGDIGIGTSSPSSITGGKTLTLYGNGTFATLSVQAFEGANNDRNATLELLSSGNGASYSQILYGDVDTTPLTPSPLVFAGYHSGTRTERMRIDSSGNVGIGTASPSTRLTVGRVDSSNEGGQIDLCRASDNASAWAVDVFGSTSTPSFRIVDNVAASARVIIDSAGRVTMPAQPAFHAYCNGTGTTSGSKLLFQTVSVNVGSNYNSSTSTFTAPVAGTYYFYGSVMANTGTGRLFWRMYKNGSFFQTMQAGGDSTNYGEWYGSAVVTLAAGDYMHLELGVGTPYATNQQEQYFGGYLLS